MSQARGRNLFQTKEMVQYLHTLGIVRDFGLLGSCR